MADARAEGAARPLLRTYQWVGLVLGLGVLGLMLLVPAPDGLSPAAWRLLAVTALMAIWWATEAIPIAATSLIPLLLFPLLGISSIDAASKPYANSVIYLFVGGFILALALEKWDLHRRLALMLLVRVGDRPSAILLGFMGVTAFISMWVSNTSATLMMLPIALSVSAVMTEEHERDGAEARRFATVLLLGVAFAASIGGLGTLVGTPPNALMAGYLRQELGIEVGFGQWMLFGVPVVAVLTPTAWLILSRWALPVNLPVNPDARRLVAEELAKLGPVTAPERRTALIFGIVAIAWIARPLLEELLGIKTLSDTSIAIAGALALFLTPSGAGTGTETEAGKGGFLMDWPTAVRLPWGVLILFGSGLSIADQMAATDLNDWLSHSLGWLNDLPPLLLVFTVVTLVVALTEFNSNTATAATILPILGAVATAGGVPPMLTIGPATLAATCGFMMPAGTAPNAVVYGTGHITVPQMVRAGFWIDVASIVILTLLGYLLMPLVF